MTNRVKELKMDSFVKVNTIRLKESHAGDGIYITLDGRQTGEPILDKLYKSIKQPK